MSNCTEIRVFGLSAAAQNRLGGATSAVLDLSAATSLRLSKSAEGLTDVNKIVTEGVLGFSAPSTPTNDAVFIESLTPLTLDNRRTYYTVSVSASGHNIRFDRLLVKGRKADTQEWDLELRRSADHWAELAQGIKLNDLNFGTYEVYQNQIEANWELPAYEGDFRDPDNTQPPFYVPLLDFGGWCDETPLPQGANEDVRVTSVALEDFRPLISLPYVLKAGFCAFGWNIDGVIFDSEWFKRLWAYALKPDYYEASNRGGRVTGRRYDRFEWQGTASAFAPTPMRFSELGASLANYVLPSDIDLITPGWLLGVKNYPNVALRYKFIMRGEFSNLRPNPLQVSFVVMEVDPDDADNNLFTGEVLSDELVVDFAAGETKQVMFEAEVLLQRGQKAAIHSPIYPTTGLWVEGGLYFSCEPASKCLMTFDQAPVKNMVRDDTNVLDWLKAAMHLIKGRVETDWETRTVTIHPERRANVFGDVVPGFFKEEDASVDISDKMVVGSIEAKPVRPTLKRYTQIGFADPEDAYILSLNLSDTDIPHGRFLTNGMDLPDGVTKIQNPLFEPTFEGQPAKIASGAGSRHPRPYLPRLWDNTDGNRSFNIGYRIFFAFGKVRQRNPSPVNATSELTSFFLNHEPNPLNDGLVTEFGYATQLATWGFESDPAIDGNVVFGTESEDLFTNFYLGITQEQRGGTRLDALVFFQMKDYVGYDFRRLFKFDYMGRPLQAAMTDIRDFSSCESLPTPVSFFVTTAETECCDLPCGCQFIECEYYQDFGLYLRSATLDDMQIESFTVDGIEQLTAPLGFGEIKILDIDGKPYIANLVDALNSVGAPYFTFEYSNRVHPQRGLRYFRVKRPVCVPFRILITHNGNDAYLYTQDEQKTKWFDVTWEPLGYGATTHDTPENCVTTTEY